MNLRFAFLGLSLILIPAALARAQERAVSDLELGLHATGVRGRGFGGAFHPFEESRLLAGGTALAGVARNWSVGAGLEVGWVDQDWTTYVYYARVQRLLASVGGFDLAGAVGLGGLTTRLAIQDSAETETDWVVPLAADVAWRRDRGSRWGVRMTVTDWIVREEVPCDCVDIGGGPAPETGEFDATHHLGISAGVFLRLGRRSP